MALRPFEADLLPRRPSKLDESSYAGSTRRFRQESFAVETTLLWTLMMMKDLIQREFGVNMSLVSVALTLKKFGFTPQEM